MKKARDFRFKRFTVSQDGATHKVGTDGVLLGAWVNVVPTGVVLDIGTGSGVIALMLAQRTTANVQIDAIELQHEDAEQAKVNIAWSDWSNRITIHEIAAQDFNPGKLYDLIVSNPPFFEYSQLPPSANRIVVRHTKALSFIELLSTVRRLLKADGRFALILPYTEAIKFIALANTMSLFCIRKCEFRTREHKPVERLLMEFSYFDTPQPDETVLLYSSGDEWSDSYKALTADFYLKL